MKYPSQILGVFAFVAALLWTWNVIHTTSAVSFETHSGIQEKLAGLIEETIKAKRPGSSEIHIDRIWTEIVSAEKVKAFFIYSFRDQNNEGSLHSTIHGEGLLERQQDDGSGKDHWTLTHVKTTNDAITFDEGLVVTPDAN